MKPPHPAARFAGPNRASLALIWTAAAVTAATLSLTSCSSPPELDKTTNSFYRQGVPGGILVQTYSITAQVAELDATNRKFTLLAPDGTRNTFTAPSADTTFDRLKLGQQVQADVTRHLVVFLRKNGEPLNGGPEGTDPNLARSETVERVAQVGAIDRKARQATLKFPDGTSQTFAVRNDVDLAKVKPGEEVVIQTSSAVVLRMQP